MLKKHWCHTSACVFSSLIRELATTAIDLVLGAEETLVSHIFLCFFFN